MALAYRLMHQISKHRHVPIWTIGSATKILREAALLRKALLIPNRNITHSGSNRMLIVQNSKLSRSFTNKSVFSMRSSQDLTFCAKSKSGITANITIVRWGSNNTYQTISQFKKPEGFSKIYENKQKILFVWFPAIMTVVFLVSAGMSLGFYLTADLEKLISENSVILDFAMTMALTYALILYIVIRVFHRRSLFSIYRKDGLEKLYIAVRPKYGFWIEEVHFKHEDVKVLHLKRFNAGKYEFFVRPEDFVTGASYDELVGSALQKITTSETSPMKGKHLDKFEEKMKKKLDRSVNQKE